MATLHLTPQYACYQVYLHSSIHTSLPSIHATDETFPPVHTAHSLVSMPPIIYTHSSIHHVLLSIRVHFEICLLEHYLLPSIHAPSNTASPAYTVQEDMPPQHTKIIPQFLCQKCASCTPAHAWKQTHTSANTPSCPVSMAPLAFQNKTLNPLNSCHH